MIKRERLRGWVAERYKGRLIPISGNPYMEHVLAVAEQADHYTPFGYEAGLCHDMLEDHICTETELNDALLRCGYGIIDTEQIIGLVKELTDGVYPGLNKKEQRALEENRLARISPAAQTVKYADLMYNIPWTIRYRPEKAPKYLKRKWHLLKRMDKGDPVLRKKVMGQIPPEFRT